MRLSKIRIHIHPFAAAGTFLLLFAMPRLYAFGRFLLFFCMRQGI